MDENKFWSLIESAWQAVGGYVVTREKLATGECSTAETNELTRALDEFIPTLRDQWLDKLSAEELMAFDRILERKLYDIDRSEIQEHTDGSDDGFLYARGFIVAAGKSFYDAVNADPAVALMDEECEEMCYISWHLYRKKFGEMPGSGISRESCSNKSGWDG